MACGKSKCVVGVHFKDVKAQDIRTNLLQYITTKKEGGTVKFSTRFRSNNITECLINGGYMLQCKTKKKGRTTFTVRAENNARETLSIKINVTIGDYPVKFIKKKLFF